MERGRRVVVHSAEDSGAGNANFQLQFVEWGFRVKICRRWARSDMILDGTGILLWEWEDHTLKWLCTSIY
jgi:hypothetical protein